MAYDYEGWFRRFLFDNILNFGFSAVTFYNSLCSSFIYSFSFFTIDSAYSSTFDITALRCIAGEGILLGSNLR
jgi:hypothetical protein